MNSLYSHNIRKKLAFKYGLTIEEVNLIVRSVFELTAKTIQEGNKETLEFKNVHVPNFGMFKVKDGRKQHFKMINDKNNSEQSDRNESCGGSTIGKVQDGCVFPKDEDSEQGCEFPEQEDKLN